MTAFLINHKGNFPCLNYQLLGDHPIFCGLLLLSTVFRKIPLVKHITRNMKLIHHFINCMFPARYTWPIPVAAQSKAWVCSRWLVGVVGSSPAGGMGAGLL